MKKVLELLLLTVIAGGQVLFAQDGEGLKISGKIETGIKATVGNAKSTVQEDFMLEPYNDDAEKKFRADVTARYATPNAGVSIRFRADDDNFVAPTGSTYRVIPYAFSPIGHAYGWFSFLNNAVEVSGGMLDNAKWGTFTDFWLDADLDNANNFKIEIRPVNGFSIGVNNMDLRSFADAAREGKTDFIDALKGTVIGLKYVSEPFGIAASFIIKDEADVKKDLLDGSGGATGLKADFGALFSLYFYGVDGLKIDLDGRFATNNDAGLKPFGIGVQANYWLSEPFYIGARAIFTNTIGSEKSPFNLEVRPQLGYDLNEVFTLGFQLPITVGGAGEKFDKMALGVGAKPQATFKLSPNAKLIMFYLLNTKKFDGDNDLAIDHTIQLNFAWMF